MTQVAQELMTPHEAARWFRRSPSWLRQQTDLLPIRSPGGQPLYHVRVCRAYVLGCLCGLDAAGLRQTQIQALASACGMTAAEYLLQPAATASSESPREPQPQPADCPVVS